VIVNATSGEVTLVAATAKSLLQAKAPANQQLVIKSLRFTGQQPAGGTDTPVKIRLTRSTSNFGTFSSAVAAKNNPNDNVTPQGTYGANASAEPTSPTDGGLWWNVQPQSGVIEFLVPDLFIPVPGGQSAQFEATSPGTPVIMLTAQIEE
jgi:hypothetical protein